MQTLSVRFLSLMMAVCRRLRFKSFDISAGRICSANLNTLLHFKQSALLVTCVSNYTCSVRCSPNQHIRSVGTQVVRMAPMNLKDTVDCKPCKNDKSLERRRNLFSTFLFCNELCYFGYFDIQHHHYHHVSNMSTKVSRWWQYELLRWKLLCFKF